MRKLIAILPALALAAVLVAETPAAKKTTGAPTAPRPAGEFVIHMTNGSQVLLSSYRGKVVVMAFMYTTCTHCQHTAGVLAKVQTEYKKDVQVLGDTIDANAQAGIPAFLKITGANFPVGYSPQAPALKFLHAPADGWYVPMLAFIDRNGMLRSQFVVTETDNSAGPWLENQDANIRLEIEKLLKIPTSSAAKQAPKS